MSFVVAGRKAVDCNGELIGGCTLIEEWHLPFVGAEVVCVPNSISGEYEEENNGKYDFTANVYGSQDSEFSQDLSTNIKHLYFIQGCDSLSQTNCFE